MSSRTEALTYPNPSRSYDEADRGVRFWGYDRTFEIAFFIDQKALSRIEPETEPDEAGFLRTFDANRDRILETAGAVYARRRKDAYVYAYTLTEADF